ncbi:hypothetical protein QBC46DRAFT_386386, partial [Diplogelasinospora grovesii]
MIITILFPELVVLRAIFEFVMALQALRLMEHDGEIPVELPWWLPPQGSSLSLGRFSQSKHQKAAEIENPPVQDDSKWTLTHCFFANMGGFYYEEGESRFPVTALQLAKNSLLFDRPTITEEEIQDRSKQDWFAKGVAALQFLQLALSLIVRTARGLAFSQLETMTLGFAVCGAIIYLVYFYKPQKVETRTPLTRRSEPGRGPPPRPLRFEKTYDGFWDVLINERSSYADTADPKAGEQVARIPNDNIPVSDSRVAHPGVFLLAFASGLFGAMHAIAWHFEFPSTVEKILWQTATVVSAGSPLVGLVIIPFAQLTVSAGDAQLFMRKCLRLMREFSWHVSDKRPVDRAYGELENILALRDATGPEAQRPYADIFGPEQNQASDLGRELLHFLQQPTDQDVARLNAQPELLDLLGDKEFTQQFRLLVDVMEGKESKTLTETAKTNVYPRKNMLPKALNQGILYVTTILYCLSRLSLMAIAFSSLRLMPESVYVSTPWTVYIPSLGSTG